MLELPSKDFKIAIRALLQEANYLKIQWKAGCSQQRNRNCKKEPNGIELKTRSGFKSEFFKM